MLVQRQNSKRIQLYLIIGGVIVAVLLGYIAYIDIFSKTSSTQSNNAIITKNVPKDFGQSIFQDSRFFSLEPKVGTDLITQAAQVIPSSVLPAPDAVQVFDTQEGNSILFGWKKPADATDATIVRVSSFVGDAQKNLATLPSSATSYIYPNAVNGARTQYEIHYAHQQIVYPSTPAAVIARAGTTSGPIQVSAVDSGGVHLQWSAPAISAQSIEVYRSDEVGKIGALIARLDTSATSYVDATGEAGISLYTVQWVGDSTNGALWTGEATATDQTAPEKPAVQTAMTKTSNGNNAVHVTWSPSTSSDVAKYLVYKSEHASAIGTLVYTYTVKDTTIDQQSLEYLDTAVQSGTTYYYSVVAVDTSGNQSTTQDLGVAGKPNPFVTQ